MAKRFGIFRTMAPDAERDFWRSEVRDYTSCSALLPGDGITDRPKYRFSFSRCAAVNFAPITALHSCYLFPEFDLDAKMSGMEVDVRAAMNQSVAAYDWSWDSSGVHIAMDFYDDTWSYREVILHIMQAIDPAQLSLNTFDCAEPPL